MAESTKLIMVVDDNPAVASVIRFNLERLGYEVYVARDGEEAWRQLERRQYDAVITDQQMPRMSGAELCQKLRASPTYGSVPIILLTAKAMEFDVQQLESECKLAAVFVKPFSPGEMVRTLENLLPRRAGDEGTVGETDEEDAPRG